MSKKTFPNFIVIDDDRINNSICRKIIQSVAPDSDIQTFFDPNAGLVYIHSTYSTRQPNKVILLLDINMPTLFGWEVLEEFKNFSDIVKQHFKIFRLSSSIDPHDKEKAAKNSLVSGYIEKPLTVLKIQAVLYQTKTIPLN
jgi:CheY-like chemotaxis protein